MADSKDKKTEPSGSSATGLLDDAALRDWRHGTYLSGFSRNRMQFTPDAMYKLYVVTDDHKSRFGLAIEHTSLKLMKQWNAWMETLPEPILLVSIEDSNGRLRIACPNGSLVTWIAVSASSRPPRAQIIGINTDLQMTRMEHDTSFPPSVQLTWFDSRSH